MRSKANPRNIPRGRQRLGKHRLEFCRFCLDVHRLFHSLRELFTSRTGFHEELFVNLRVPSSRLLVEVAPRLFQAQL